MHVYTKKAAHRSGPFSSFNSDLRNIDYVDLPIAATIPVWLNDDDLIPTTSKISIPTPITITTVTIVNTDTSTTGANAELNALSGRRSGTKQGSGSDNN